ncbi:uncharacterized protein BO97DRAFT_397560 [Aspergillus homomorphus CBS 101889]|uniref:Uncharacterized protein n=1 Tax=Aspergillus homomorphus (strain CBS 101889) TaxID=1450537 RepID=A0A395HLU8_ASPHC|nr:hypothetical protein BO97DRAFT_397560 [Aspergillus homomorphus CBS 101889]RAL08740.1 hypothetical protein BO97DRAFT_397560 [Aspergillus homomorphus CBS 101889]
MLECGDIVPPAFNPFPLTPLDHLLPRLHMTCFFYFATRSPITDVSILENGLDLLIAQNPILAGDVCPASQSNGKANRFEVRPPTATSLEDYPLFLICMHTGEYFYRPKSARSRRVTGRDLSQAKYRPVPLDAVDRERTPGLRWQANVFDDGIVLGVCHHHLFHDAIGLYIILRALAACCQSPKLTGQVSLQSVDTDCRQRIIKLGKQVGSMPGTGRRVEIFSSPKKTVDITGDRIAVELITIPFEAICRLKEACIAITADMLGSVARNVDPGSPEKSQAPPIFSDNDVAAALMWLCWMRSHYHQPQHSPQPHETSMVMMIELRHKSRGLLPLEYIGNALAPVAASAPLSPVINSPVKTVAADSQDNSPEMYRRIPGISTYDLALLADLTFRAYKTYTKVDDRYIRDLIREKQISPDWRSDYPSDNQFGYSNMRLMNLSDIDFGKVLGRIVGFDVPDFRTNGQCWVLPAPTRMAPWEFRVSMEREDMQRFLGDPLLAWAMGQNVARL